MIDQFITFQGSVEWVLAHGYALFFVAMLIEGPVVTAAGAFVANLGYFNIFIVLLLSILGNLIPDVIFYALGYWGRFKLVNKYAHYFKLSPEKIAHLEYMAHKHAGKAITLSKLVPFLATPGLMIIGAVRMPLKKYVIWSLALILPSSLFFLIVGYYFGSAYNTINHYLNMGGYLIIAGIILFIIVYLIYRKISKTIAERIDN